MHVGIMPLPQGAWEYGMSGYKLVQYMAACRPVVASPVGVNCDVVMEGVNSFFARTEDEWVERLEQFRCNPALTSTAWRGRAGNRRELILARGDSADHRGDLAGGGCNDRATAAADPGRDAP
jgi:glycosyltransferase involved in cell wall biosynthesis